MPNNQPVGVMTIVLSADAASYTEAITEAQRKLDSLAGKAKTAGHSTVSSMQAASAAIRELNGDFTNNIRAVERFVTQNQAVGALLKDIFPVVGGLAFVAVLGEGVKKAYEFVQAAEKMPRVLELGFRTMIQSQMTANDELRITNDRIEDQIAKLEHKPQNGMALALDEARLSADRLAESLTKDLKAIQDLMNQNQSGMLAQLFLGKGATAGVDHAIELYYSDEGDLAYQKQKATQTGNLNRADEIQRKMDARREAEKQRLIGEIDYRSPNAQDDSVARREGDQTANLVSERAALQLILGAEDRDKQNSRNQTDTKRLGTDENAKAAAENTRKAAADRLRAMETDLEQRKAVDFMTLGQERDFWAARVSSFTKGSTEYLTILRKEGELERSEMAKAHETLVKLRSEKKRADAEDSAAAAKLDEKDPMAEWKAAQAKAFHETMQASNELNQTHVTLKAKFDEFNVGEGAGKWMTQLAAATQLATIHTQAYEKELRGLRTELDAENDPKKRAELLGKIGTLATNRTIQIQQDAQNANLPTMTSPYVGLKDALNDLARSAQEAAGAFKSWFDGALGSTNQGIVQELTTKHRHGDPSIWGGIGHDIFASGTSSLLKMGEGKLLSAFGFGGKAAPKGTMGDPLYVKSLTTATGGAGVISSAAGSIGGVVGSVLNLFPHFADGVTNFSGGWAVTGERGPEFAYHPPGTSVIPNGRMPSGAGGDTHIHNWDFRGSTMDRAQVMQMLTHAAPQIVSQAVKATVNANSRKQGGIFR